MWFRYFVETKLKQIYLYEDQSEMVTMMGGRMEECDKDRCREQQMD